MNRTLCCFFCTICGFFEKLFQFANNKAKKLGNFHKRTFRGPFVNEVFAPSGEYEVLRCNMKYAHGRMKYSQNEYEGKNPVCDANRILILFFCVRLCSIDRRDQHSADRSALIIKRVDRFAFRKFRPDQQFQPILCFITLFKRDLQLMDKIRPTLTIICFVDIGSDGRCRAFQLIEQGKMPLDPFT